MFIILTLTVIGLIFIFFKYLLHKTVKSHATLLYQEDFHYYKLQSMIYFFLSIVIGSVVFTLLFNFVFTLMGNHERGAIAVIGRHEISNINPTALFFAFFLSIIALQFILKRKLKEKLAFFYNFMENQYPIKINSKALLISCLFLFGFAAIASYKFTAENHILFYQNNLNVIRWYELNENTYSYDDINDVKYVLNSIAPNGNIVMRPHYILNFKDGSSFNSSRITTSQKDIMAINAILVQRKIQIQVLKFE